MEGWKLLGPTLEEVKPKTTEEVKEEKPQEEIKIEF